jgi:cobalt-zinc-cadmium efflux system outer membrane protein
MPDAAPTKHGFLRAGERSIMKLEFITMMLLSAGVFMLTGCATSPSRTQRTALHETTRQVTYQNASDSRHVTPAESVGVPATRTQLVAHQEEVPTPHAHSDFVVPPAAMPEGDTALTLQDLEAMALANNPTLVQADAQIRAARGASYQAGLCPNPFVGYEGEYNSIGQGPDESSNGGFVAQEFVTGGKLRLSRAKWDQRARIAETNLHAQQHRVLNDVRAQFYRTLAAQQLVEVSRELLTNGEDNLQTYREMLNLGQTNQSGLLRAEVDLERDRLGLKQAEFELDHAWRTLTSLIAVPELSRTSLAGSLAGSLEHHEEPIDWDSALNQVLSSSPELQAAWQKIQHDEITIQRERAEPIPNLIAGVTTTHSPVANTTQTTFNLGIPLPVFDRNQGTVRQAQADLMQSHAETRRLELELRNRLALQYRVYRTAWQNVHDYEATMLPKAKRSYDLLHASYKERRAAWPDVLMAQRYYLTLRSEQLNNLVMYRESDVAIRGMLLSGGLSTPPSPIGGGHIDAVPKPR